MAAAGRVLELVVFKLNDGVSRDRFLAASDAVSAWLAGQRGFLSRDLAYDGDGGRWIDVVWWESLEHATTAAERATTSTECAPMFALIDRESLLMLHATQAIPSIGSGA